MNPIDQTIAPPLILASSSRYRRELLERLRIPFTFWAPNLDESRLPQEKPSDLAFRLALAKAQTIAKQHPNAVVIGSDQVADLDGLVIGKPHTHEKAVEQLLTMSGKKVVFHTAVAVVRADTGYAKAVISPVVVQFRNLHLDQIERYLNIEKPYDCAGSAKSEGLGVALLESIQSNDATALIGLPLTLTCTLLTEAGLTLI